MNLNKNEIKKIDELIRQVEHQNVKPILDGIIDIEKYDKAKYKILWVLKEVNANENDKGGWYFRDFITNEILGYSNWRRTWNMVIYTTWGILNDFPLWKKQSKKWEEEHTEILQHIAIINLKKVPGGSKSSDKEIKKAFNQDKELIINQINTYNPDIIIFGGTAKYLNNSDFDRINNKRVIVRAYHPNAHINHEKYYKGVIFETRKGLKL